MTLASIRQRFWPLCGQRIVRQIIHKCIKCFKTASKSVQPIMGNLPGPRVQPSRPFTNVGVDFCRPFHVRESKRRNAKVVNSYVVVFVCLAVKAVHLELASDLSTECFLNVLKRFVSRQSKSVNILLRQCNQFCWDKQ